jgi:ABC-type uncharacterized transport system substrate-binding protein
MKRREFICLLGSAAASASASLLAARAQPSSRAIRRVGVLMGFDATDPEAQSFQQAFRQQLMEFGWIDGRNVTFEYRWATGDPEHFKLYAAELVALHPDVILANTSPAVTVLLRETTTIPIVFVQVTDPLGQGIVGNLAHPGGNVTGFSFVDFTVAGKWLEGLKEIAPTIKRVAIIYNPLTMPFRSYLPSLASAATSLGMEMIPSPVLNDSDIENAVMAIGEGTRGGLSIIGDPFTTEHRDRIIEVAARYGVPAMYPRRIFVADGGLIAYGTDVVDLFKSAAGYVDRVLKGEKPGDLPVQTPTKYELVINLKTARRLGLSIPTALLASADEVIE